MLNPPTNKFCCGWDIWKAYEDYVTHYAEQMFSSWFFEGGGKQTNSWVLISCQGEKATELSSEAMNEAKIEL